MKKLAPILGFLLLAAPSLFAQNYRDRPYPRYYGDNTFDVTPFAGYQFGGTIDNNQTSVYGGDSVEVQSSAAYGVSFGIPLHPNGLKLELLVNRQDTTVNSGAGSIFDSGTPVGDLHVTYYQAGLLVPLNQAPPSRATTFFVVSAGIANLDPATQGVSSANKFSASAGIGVKIPITPNLSLRFEGRSFFTSLNSNDNCNHCGFGGSGNNLFQSEVNAGLAVRF